MIKMKEIKFICQQPNEIPYIINDKPYFLLKKRLYTPKFKDLHRRRNYSKKSALNALINE